MDKEEQKKLRRKAEQVVEKEDQSKGSSLPDVETLNHELRVHQAELEMQNQQLMESQLELGKSRDRYVDLYDFAPVGYFTLNHNNHIVEANLTACDMLKVNRAKLLNMVFTRFIAENETESFYFFCNKAVQSGTRQTIELEMHTANSAAFYAHVEGIAEANIGLRLAVVDVTKHKKLEQELAKHRENLEKQVHERTWELRWAREELRHLYRRIIKAQEDERTAIARELHDQTGQTLSVLNLTLAHIKRVAPETANDVAEAQSMVRDILTQIRTLSSSLHPSMLDTMGLGPTLSWYFPNFTSRTKIDIDFRQSGMEEKLSPEISLAAYRIIQEALTNVARYAGVDRVTVQARKVDSTLHVEVTDKGKGFDRSKVPLTCSGLRGMQERVVTLGGIVEIKSAPGEGTTVKVEIPITHKIAGGGVKSGH